MDDTPENLQLLTGMLKDRGYKARPVPSGKLALSAARREVPDLILLDINMPDMNGYDVCEELKKDEQLKGVPVIFISALTEPLDKVKAFAIGGVDYLTKPFQMTELHARVETHLKLRRLQLELEQVNAQLKIANNRMNRDLQAAARIQKTFLPCAVPNVPGTQLAWAYQPCDEIGGDGLNIVPFGDGQVGMCILDVSGHGVSSALLSVALSRVLSAPSEPASILVRERDGNNALQIRPPVEVAENLNRLFPFDVAIGQFATLVYGIFSVSTGDFRYTSAAHPGPLHLPARGAPAILNSPGFPIGLAEEPFAEYCIHLSPGDRLYLYSDGLPDAMNPAHEPFADARILDTIDRCRTEPLEHGIATLLAEIARWRGTEKPQDDMSILAIEVAV